MRKVVSSKDQCLREAPGGGLMILGISLQLFQNLLVRIRCRDLALDFGSIEDSLIFEEVKLAGARIRVDFIDLLSLTGGKRPSCGRCS